MQKEVFWFTQKASNHGRSWLQQFKQNRRLSRPERVFRQEEFHYRPWKHALNPGSGNRRNTNLFHRRYFYHLERRISLKIAAMSVNKVEDSNNTEDSNSQKKPSIEFMLNPAPGVAPTASNQSGRSGARPTIDEKSSTNISPLSATKIPTLEDAVEALQIVKSYVECQSSGLVEPGYLDDLEQRLRDVDNNTRGWQSSEMKISHKGRRRNIENGATWHRRPSYIPQRHLLWPCIQLGHQAGNVDFPCSESKIKKIITYCNAALVIFSFIKKSYKKTRTSQIIMRLY